MSNPLYTYDASQVSVIVGGFAMTGFADGSAVTIDRDEDAFSLSVGTDGESARSKSNNFAGKITIKLMQTSPSNDVLTAFAKADELSNAGIVPAMVKDNLGRSMHMAENAWVERFPSSDFARESGVREWVLRTNHLENFVGGTNA